ncbi:hypothetical protein T492DRAFT_834743 [Pavlovales sp. CCMP2436]|nr:hypothetical protein T492DRAFT_834743 [Pavlovales sp. CCMP2436]
MRAAPPSPEQSVTMPAPAGPPTPLTASRMRAPDPPLESPIITSGPAFAISFPPPLPPSRPVGAIDANLTSPTIRENPTPDIYQSPVMQRISKENAAMVASLIRKTISTDRLLASTEERGLVSDEQLVALRSSMAADASRRESVQATTPAGPNQEPGTPQSTMERMRSVKARLIASEERAARADVELNERLAALTLGRADNTSRRESVETTQEELDIAQVMLTMEQGEGSEGGSTLPLREQQASASMDPATPLKTRLLTMTEVETIKFAAAERDTKLSLLDRGSGIMSAKEIHAEYDKKKLAAIRATRDGLQKLMDYEEDEVRLSV